MLILSAKRPNRLYSADGVLVAATFQAVREIFGKKGKSDSETVVKVKALRPLMNQLNYFKLIHNLCQEFLNFTSDHLFGDGTRVTVNDDTSVKDIKERWKTYYEERFANKIEQFKLHAAPLLLYDNLDEINEEEYRSELDVDIVQHIYALNKNSTKAHNAVYDFIKVIEDRSNNVLKKNIIDEVTKWRDPIESRAKRALSSTDNTLMDLIPVLSFLYARTIN